MAAQVTVGLLVLLFTVAEQVAVQPVDRSVTVTVYVPAANPLWVASVDPLLHGSYTVATVCLRGSCYRRLWSVTVRFREW
ncbi:MAG: hypothetical protein IPO27_07510 [Bacteroidetes bacterium]|nr:hypothetical protein [Bacteroidota bacterium]